MSGMPAIRFHERAGGRGYGDPRDMFLPPSLDTTWRSVLGPICLASTISLIYSWAAWGHVGGFWGDSGRWLHEVDRFAHGEQLYGDYYWPFPPLALWIVGSYGRLFGSETHRIWIATSILCSLIFVLYSYYSCLLLNRYRMIVTCAGVMMASAAVFVGGAALPTGGYTPAAPLGFLFLLSCFICSIGTLRGNKALSLAVGLFSGLCVITKQDFWAPAFVLFLGVIIWLISIRARLQAFFATIICIAVIVGASVAIVKTAGWPTLAGVVHGFGHVRHLGFRGFPTLEKFTVQIASFFGLMLLVLLCGIASKAIDARKIKATLLTVVAVALLAGLTHIFVNSSYSSGIAESNDAFTGPAFASEPLPLRRSTILFCRQLEAQAFPLPLPLFACGCVLLLWTRFRNSGDRNMVLLLLAACFAARLRRGYEYTEWYAHLLELPLYILLMTSCLPETIETRRGLRVFLTCVIALGALIYWDRGQGYLTRDSDFTRVDTPRGVVYLSHTAANDYRNLRNAVDRLDPSKRRPLFALGYNGGMNYFLDRRNSTPLTQGFTLSNFESAYVIDKLKKDPSPPILVDNLFFHNLQSEKWTGWTWRMTPTPSIYSRFDWPIFAELLKSCTQHSTVDGAKRKPLFVIYDCKFN